MEKEILHIFKHREMYDRFSSLIKEHTLTREAYQIFIDMEEYYKLNEDVDVIDWNKFASWFRFIKHTTYKLDKIELYNKIFSDLYTYIVDPSSYNTILKVLIDRDYAARIRTIAQDMETEDSSEYDILDIDSLVTKYKEETDKFDKGDEFISTDFTDLLAAIYTGKGYDWRITNLNESIGPIRKGNFIVIGARPDSGKTTFLCSEVSHIASQLEPEEHLLWFNNEEVGELVNFRTLQASIGWTQEDIDKRPYEANMECEKVLGSKKKIRLIDEKILSTKYIEQMCKKYKPSVIVFDQLWKVTGFNKTAATETERQTLLFAWARGLAKEYGPVLAVHQLGGDAEGEKWPSMRSLYGSQTGIQGEADAIINIGRSLDPKEQDLRFFNIPKNKMGRGSACIKEYRNARFFLKIKPEIARFEDVGVYSIS